MPKLGDGSSIEVQVGPTPDQLIAALHRLGIRHLATMTPAPEDVPLSPRDLLIGLAACPDARVRSALVPLFLWRPDFASAAPDAAAETNGQARVMLLCCYAAAVSLERQLADAPTLPNLFERDLGLSAFESPAARLKEVARRHALLSGRDINWQGTYEHAVAVALRFVEPAVAWSR